MMTRILKQRKIKIIEPSIKLNQKKTTSLPSLCQTLHYENNVLTF